MQNPRHVLTHGLRGKVVFFRDAFQFGRRQRLVPIMQKTRDGRIVFVRAVDAGKLFRRLRNAQGMHVARRLHALFQAGSHIFESV